MLAPSAILPPLMIFTGGSLTIVFSISSQILVQGLSVSDIRFNAGISDCFKMSFIGAMVRKARANCRISRGLIFPSGTFEINRSKSPTVFNKPYTSCSCVGFSIKNCTISCRPSIVVLVFNGNNTHFFIKRAPIGETVLSKTSINVLPFSC